MNLTPEKEIFLSDLIHFIKKKGLPLKFSMISWFDYKSNIFVYTGNDPLPSYIVIPLNRALKKNTRKVIKRFYYF